MMKTILHRILPVALLCMTVLLTILLAGCGGASGAASGGNFGGNSEAAKETMESTEAAEVKAISMYDLRTALLAADPTLPEMMSVSDSDKDAASLFAYLSDLDYEKVAQFTLSYSSEGKADEIAVIAVKDEKDVKEAKKSLEDHLDERKKLYQSYDAEQLKRTESAQVFTQDRYAVLIIGDHVQDVKAAFEDFLKEA